jgi:hypothetical protein
MKNLPKIIKNTIDNNIQNLLNYEFYNINSIDNFMLLDFPSITINSFDYFIKPEYNYKLYERNLSFSKIFIDLDGLPDDFNVIEFINDFNKYLKNIKYKYDNVLLYDDMTNMFEKDLYSNNLLNKNKNELNKNENLNDLVLTPIYLITKNDNSSNHYGNSYHIIVNYYTYPIINIIYIICDFIVSNSKYKPYIDLTVYLSNHYLRCINQFNVKRINKVNKNDKHYIYKIYSPNYPNLNLINVLDQQTQILLSFINNTNNRKILREMIIDIDIPHNWITCNGDVYGTNTTVFSELLFKLMKQHGYDIEL